ncbi:transcription termination factor 5, mitochondrial-like [Centruroides sculpturatus]|uniref:transcription termination factor 5, mitochondrial-like n=1 Tax=Centruroides sculpturatus TaxID=218467 RepID=UPI000C6EA3C5|nr:transcription termination factor 5, mitochondrial-like [Centruroides sculpturatus]XP_023243966.1 transcription termination factor 5, mitochondrial-like [Centruroides sculpturatus]XP_023243967.1 transcription termination factor 5, mitochondrial-like [Centruroides sculpturatus]
MHIIRNRNVFEFINRTLYNNLTFVTSANIICDKCGQVGVCSAQSSDQFIVREGKTGLCSRYLASFLGCSHLTAINIMADCPRIITTKPDHLQNSLETLKKHFEYLDIIKNSSVLVLKPFRIEELIRILEEIGVSKITVNEIVRFPSIMGTSVKTLIKEGIINNHEKIIKNMIKELDAPVELTDLWQSRIHKILWKKIENMSPRYIRMSILHQYLVWKLKCNKNEIRSTINRSFYSRCCHTLRKTLNVLINDYKFSEREILRNAFLIKANPNNLKKILQNHPVLAGLDIKECFKKYPALVNVPADNILKVNNILKENGFTDTQLQNHLSVYHYSFYKIQKILKVINDNADLALRKFHPNSLKLVDKYDTAIERFYHIQRKGLLCISLSALYNQTELEKTDPNVRQCVIEIAEYLALELNKSKREITKTLEIYPNTIWPSLLNAKKVTEYLLSNGVTKEQIWNGIPIVFYSLDSVVKYFNKLSHYKVQPQCDWKNHKNYIQLLLYFIEKESGINLENCNLEKNEKLMLKSFTDEHSGEKDCNIYD